MLQIMAFSDTMRVLFFTYFFSLFHLKIILNQWFFPIACVHMSHYKDRLPIFMIIKHILIILFPLPTLCPSPPCLHPKYISFLSPHTFDNSQASNNNKIRENKNDRTKLHKTNIQRKEKCQRKKSTKHRKTLFLSNCK